MSDRLEFPLAQGWSRGLTIAFENAPSSGSLNLDNFLHVEQVHGKEIYVAGPQDLQKKGPLAKADGIYCQGDWIKEARRALLIKTADCAPLFYIDRESQALCALHAGWRGLQLGIHRVPFEKKWFDPKFTWIWAGPSLNGENFEVDRDMWSQFPSELQRDATIFSPVAGNSEKRYFQTWRYLEREFKALGVDLLYNVEVDTFEDHSFASYRRAKKMGQSCGRNYSWMGFTEG